MVVNNKGEEHSLGGTALQSSGSNLLGEPQGREWKEIKTMGAFRSSLSTQWRSKEQREASNTREKGNYFLIHSPNHHHDPGTTCGSSGRNRASAFLPAFLPFQAGRGDEECGCRLASALLIPTPKPLGTIELCLWHV